MMTTRRSFLAVGGAAAVAATLAACSSQSGKGSGSAAGGITLWTHNGGNKEELDVVNSAVKDFNAANPDTQVTVKSFPQESYNDAIASAAVSGNLPDILDLDGPIMPNWAWAGYLSPLTISQDLQDKVIDSAKGVWNDKLYSVGPYDTSLCFLGRKSAFDQAGVAVPTIDKPWTKDEFMDALDKLSKLDGFEHAIDMSVWDTAEWWPYAYAPLLQSFGGDLIDRKTYGTAEGFLNSDKAVEWGTWFRSLFTSNYASQTPAKDGQDFLQGKVPLVYTGGWKVLKVQETFGADDGLILPRGSARGRRLLAVGCVVLLEERRGCEQVHRVPHAGQVPRPVLGRDRHFPVDRVRHPEDEVLRRGQAAGARLRDRQEVRPPTSRDARLQGHLLDLRQGRP